jgi:hypothetical protein
MAALILASASRAQLIGAIVGTFFLLGIAVAVFAQPVDVEVGADGVLLSNRFRRSFLSYAAMSDAIVEAADVVLLMTDGRRVHLGVNHRGRFERALGNEREEYLSRMATQIREGIAAHRRGESPPDVATLVARGGRSTEAWVAALAQIPDALAAFRTAAVPEDQLWRIVENSSLDESTRAGAAVALRGQLDETKRARLRMAAAASVSPCLRVALESVERASDDDALESVLDAFEPSAVASSRRRT